MSLQKNRKYNLTIILDSRGYEAPVETIQEKIAGMLQSVGGEVESLENIGRNEFTRITDKGHTGDSYFTGVVTGPATLPGAFQDAMRLDRLLKQAMFRSA